MPNSELLITKVKLSGNKPVIHYEEEAEGKRPKRCEVDITDSAPQLRVAMQALMSDAIALAHLDEEAWNNYGELLGLSIKHDGDDSGFCMTAVAKIPKPDGRVEAVVSNTPYLLFTYVDDSTEAKINQVEQQAAKYVNSGPAQLSLGVEGDAAN